jgi:hypothetical protein
VCSAGNSNILILYGNNKKKVVLSSTPIKIRVIKGGVDGGEDTHDKDIHSRSIILGSGEAV